MTVLLLDLDGVLIFPSASFERDLLAAADWRAGGPRAFLAELADDPAHLAALLGDGDVLAAMAPVLERHALPAGMSGPGPPIERVFSSDPCCGPP